MGKKRHNEKAVQRSEDLNVKMATLAAEHGYDVLGGDAAEMKQIKPMLGSAFNYSKNLHEVASSRSRRAHAPEPVKIDMGLAAGGKRDGSSMIRKRSGLTPGLRLNAAVRRPIGPQSDDDCTSGGHRSVAGERLDTDAGQSKATKRRNRKRRSKEAAGGKSKAARNVSGGPATLATNVEVGNELKFTDGHQTFLDSTHWNLPKSVNAGSSAATDSPLRFAPNISTKPFPTSAAVAAIVMVRDAREAICKLRTPTWCLSCVQQCSQMLMQTGDAELQKDGLTLLRGVRQQLVQTGGSGSKGTGNPGDHILDKKTLIKVLINLDEVYFKCHYFVSTTGIGLESAITPLVYFRSTGPAPELAAAAVAEFKASAEMQSGGDTLGLLKWSAKEGAVAVPATPSNPLLENLRLRFLETVVLFHHSGLALDGRFHEALVASRAGCSEQTSQEHRHQPNQKQTKKSKKSKKKEAAAAAAAVADANEPICDELLASWRNSCRDWLARFYGFVRHYPAGF